MGIVPVLLTENIRTKNELSSLESLYPQVANLYAGHQLFSAEVIKKGSVEILIPEMSYDSFG